MDRRKPVMEFSVHWQGLLRSFRVSLRTKIRRMKEENTKRTPMFGRVRLMFKMLAAFTLAMVALLANFG